MNEIQIGPILFEYDRSRHKMFLSKGEDALSMVEGIWEDDWTAFVNCALDRGTFKYEEAIERQK